MPTQEQRKGRAGERGVRTELCRLEPAPVLPREGGIYDMGDIHTRYTCWQIKAGAYAHNASPKLIAQWMAETEVQAQRANKSDAVLVVARRGYGPNRAEMWRAIMRLSAFLGLTETGEDHLAGDELVEMNLSALVSLMSSYYNY